MKPNHFKSLRARIRCGVVLVAIASSVAHAGSPLDHRLGYDPSGRTEFATPSDVVVPTGSPVDPDEILWTSTDLGFYHDGQNWLGGAAPRSFQAAVFDGDTTDIVPVVFDSPASNVATFVRAGNFEFRTFENPFATDRLSIDGRIRASDAILTIDAGETVTAVRVEVVSDVALPNGAMLNLLNGTLESGDAVVFGGSAASPAMVNMSAPWMIGDSLFVGGDEWTSSRYAEVASHSASGRMSVGRRLHLWENGALTFAASSDPAYAVIGHGVTDAIGGNVYVTSDGLLSGDGAIRRASVRNAGRVRVAERGTTGRLTIDGTGQGDFESNFIQLESGKLEMDLGGAQEVTEHDQLHVVTGGAELGGVLDLSVINEYTPQVGDELALITLGPGASGSIVGAFDAIRAERLADANPNVAVDIEYANNVVLARFVATSSDIQFQESNPVSNWVDPENWTTGVSPTSLNPIVVDNATASPLRVVVADNETPGSANAFVHSLEVAGVTEEMTIAVNQDAFLSSTTSMRVAANGHIDLEGGTVVATQFELKSGGTLSGVGTIVADVVTEGRIAPGDSPGSLRIDGDLAANPGSMIEIEIGGPPEGSEFDFIDVTGDVSVGGDLIVSVIGLSGNGASGVYEPNVGDRFEIVRTENGSIVGQFANFFSLGLPSTIAWQLSSDTGVGVGASISITAVATLPGDFDGDGDVDEEDFMTWQVGYGALTGAAREEGDADGDGDVDGDDFLAWQSNFGATLGGLAAHGAAPEPSSLVLLFLSICLLSAMVRHRAFD